MTEVEDPHPKRGELLIDITKASVNPIDYYTITSLKVSPLPHIPGTEFTGTVSQLGEEVKGFSEGDRVAIYTRFFDGRCDMCIKGREMLCRNGGRIGVDTDGGFAEKIAVNSLQAFKFDGPEEIAASLPVAALTAYHALKEAEVKLGTIVVVLGASGNTGMFATQLARKMGATVIAVSRKSWPKELGANEVVDYSEAEKVVREVTDGKMADVVINSLGAGFWDSGMNLLGVDSKLVTFGTLTGHEVKLDLSKLYSKHVKLIGTNRGSLREFSELVEICRDCKVRVWKEFELEEGADAVRSVLSRERDGRVLINVS
ncbi:alcohol dehydrogenase [Sulfodiicoccus acidiphilus]|uniref:Alcohol dehydrogenase n=1 Tax=Sulfodiicoccus acidiphilus TaxID=1670455 RepID=A0A348B0Z0_9CREN|nr:alcohol dehydrogenase [Sulfodiicoccus acidiphilus]GGU02402.1 alcohol dehydrogenase [Sulfodiicoccus acidiphilus]